MENTGQENTNIGETLDNESIEPIVIEKPKKERKKRETQSPAQIEALCKGREILKENRKRQREAKKQGVVIDKTSPEYMKEFKDTFDNMIKTIEERYPSREPIHVQDTPSPSPIQTKRNYI